MRLRNINTLVCGTGVNDADYIVQPTVNGKIRRCKFYTVWKSMIERCYSKNGRYRSYSGCTVDKEWHSFMAFRGWMIIQDWRGKHLDKDVLVDGNKIYSKLTCCFVSREVNNIVSHRKANSGKYKTGVYLHKQSGLFSSDVNAAGKRVNIGYFKSHEEAHLAYRKAKANELMRVAGLQDNRGVKFALARRAIIMANPPEDSLHKRTEDGGWAWVPREGK